MLNNLNYKEKCYFGSWKTTFKNGFPIIKFINSTISGRQTFLQKVRNSSKVAQDQKTLLSAVT